MLIFHIFFFFCLKLDKNQIQTGLSKPTESYTVWPFFPSVFEQRDAADYFEKILGLTSPTASQVKRSRISLRTCGLNETYLLTSFWNSVLSDLPRSGGTQIYMLCVSC